VPKLTKRVLDGFRPRPGAADTYAWDSELKGFGVRFMPSGTGTYILKYRTTEGGQRKLKLARLGALTPEEARALARKRLGEIAGGDDPSANRRAIRKAITVAELCDLYVEEAEGRVKASTLAMDKSRIERHVKPLIGRKSVVGLSSEDLERLQADILSGKSAAARKGRGGHTTGGRGVAARTIGMLGTILEFARRRKLIKENPAQGVRKLAGGRQRRFLSLPEIAQLGTTLRDGNHAPPAAAAAIQLLLLTGCRRMEVLSLPWAWVDQKAKCLRLADSKSGFQIRPIGAAAVALLDALPRREGSPWVLPAERGDGHFVGLPRVLDRVCREAGLDGVTVHVLRHSFAAAAAEMGFSELTIAGLLGHQVAGVTARYAHVPDSALVAAADKVSATLWQSLGQPKAEVASGEQSDVAVA
jgi:integrase